MYKLGLLANGIMSGRRKRITKEARAKYWGKAWESSRNSEVSCACSTECRGGGMKLEGRFGQVMKLLID